VPSHRASERSPRSPATSPAQYLANGSAFDLAPPSSGGPHAHRTSGGRKASHPSRSRFALTVPGEVDLWIVRGPWRRFCLSRAKQKQGA
jgi:hypothetical protein